MPKYQQRATHLIPDADRPGFAPFELAAPVVPGADRNAALSLKKTQDTAGRVKSGHRDSSMRIPVCDLRRGSATYK